MVLTSTQAAIALPIPTSTSDDEVIIIELINARPYPSVSFPSIWAILSNNVPHDDGQDNGLAVKALTDLLLLMSTK
ncbi:MAG: hypothetical protein ACOC1L_08070 [Bacillota bacterium]